MCNEECLILGYWYRMYIFDNNKFWQTFSEIFKEHQNDIINECDFEYFIEFHELDKIDNSDFERIHVYFINYCNSIENIQNKFKFL